MNRQLARGAKIFGIMSICLGMDAVVKAAIFALLTWQRRSDASFSFPGVMKLLIALPMMVGALGLINSVSGVGVLLLKNWGRLLTLVSAGLWFLILAGAVATKTLHLTVVILVLLVWYGSMLWYFLRPSVKAQFQAARSRA